MVVYGSAVAVFFVLTAVLIGGFQSVLNDSLARSNELDDLISSSQTSLPVSSQYEPLAVTNKLVNYVLADNSELGAEEEIYTVVFKYNISNTYEYDIDLNNAAISMLQGGENAKLVKVNSLTSNQLEVNDLFNGLSIRELLGSPYVLEAGESAAIRLSVDLAFSPEDSPVRNIFDVIGTKTGTGISLPASFPSSYVTASSSSTTSSMGTDVEPVSYGSSSSSSSKNLFNGSAVSVFFPGIELSSK